MNDHPNDFNSNDLGDAQQQEQASRETESKESFARQEPYWYSVNNGGFGPPIDQPTPRKPGRGKRIGAIAAALALFLVLSVLAGFGGALLIDHFGGDGEYDATLPNDSDLPQTITPTDGEGVSDGIDYPYTDMSYDFTAALSELVKNNDSALIGSPNGSAGDAKKSLIEVTAAVKDSVVEIATTTVSNHGTISAGAGSGVIIHEDGIIVTNNHVIEDCDQIIVRLTNGDTYEAALRGTDEQGDIALLKITPQADKPLTVAKLGYSKALALGEEVIAIGNPLGQLGGTVTNGIISALEREIRVDGNTMTLLQTNAAINAGNSGGGLFNMAGELIGVVNAKYSATGVEGLGFAIPIDTAYEDSFTDLLKYGYIRGIPTLGITLTEHTGGGGFFTPTYYGAYVYAVGTQTDFQVGDYIYSIDGNVVYAISTSAVAAVESIVRSHRVGDTIKVVVKRGDAKVELSITLQEYVPADVGLGIE